MEERITPTHKFPQAYNAFDFQPKSKNGAIKVNKDGDLSVLGIKFGMEFKESIQKLSKDYKIDFASSPEANVIQADNICLNPRATSCMVHFNFNPTTNTLQSISLVSKYATNFCWCFRELSSTPLIEFSEAISNDNKTYWFYTEKCKIKVSCYTFETSGKTIEKQLATITKQDAEGIKPSKRIKQQATYTDKFWRIFAIIAIIAFCLIGYLNAAKNRYRSFNEGYFILDSWTGKVYDIEDRYASPK